MEIWFLAQIFKILPIYEKIRYLAPEGCGQWPIGCTIISKIAQILGSNKLDWVFMLGLRKCKTK